MSEIDIAAIRRGHAERRLCGVCCGLSPSWDGHDRDCEGAVWQAVPRLLDEIEKLRSDNRRLACIVASDHCPECFGVCGGHEDSSL